MSSPASDVDTYMQKLKHPLKPELDAVRQTILGASKTIAEGIKWNAPSFRVEEWFATAMVRKTAGRECVHLILHFGAKPKVKRTPPIKDPAGILEWLGPDRAQVKFHDMVEVTAKQKALAGVVKEWIKHL